MTLEEIRNAKSELAHAEISTIYKNHAKYKEILASREKWHAMLDEAMDQTEEGESFLPNFVKLVLQAAQK